MVRRHPELFPGDGITVVNPFIMGHVEILQNLLKSTDSLSANAASDGQFGNQTTEAVQRFQRAVGLSQTGEVRKDTWAKLWSFFPNQSGFPDDIVILPRDFVSTTSPVPGGNLSAAIAASQFDSRAAIYVPMLYQACFAQGITDKGQIAYVLATAEHESQMGKSMVEFASGDAYEGRRDLGNVVSGDGRRYKGRGFVQLTGRRNYTYMSKILGIDLENNPDLAAQHNIAAPIIAIGMRDGIFTGAKLSRYISGATRDFVNARRIINGLDRANDIAGYANQFYATLP